LQVGDKVELLEGYERFGDASNGPLHPGERGAVVDLQEGPTGERYVHSKFTRMFESTMTYSPYEKKRTGILSV
jgi:hypothetical protein